MTIGLVSIPSDQVQTQGIAKMAIFLQEILESVAIPS